mmetsp:Transcript_11416/g.32882  ORF Transcript_11416/g.32882 Transcript_11416/m.32882 type:complete len:274 (-) Transcript_11416:708-1529(-)
MSPSDRRKERRTSARAARGLGKPRHRSRSEETSAHAATPPTEGWTRRRRGPWRASTKSCSTRTGRCRTPPGRGRSPRGHLRPEGGTSNREHVFLLLSPRCLWRRRTLRRRGRSRTPRSMARGPHRPGHQCCGSLRPRLGRHQLRSPAAVHGRRGPADEAPRRRTRHRCNTSPLRRRRCGSRAAAPVFVLPALRTRRLSAAPHSSCRPSPSVCGCRASGCRPSASSSRSKSPRRAQPSRRGWRPGPPSCAASAGRRSRCRRKCDRGSRPPATPP